MITLKSAGVRVQLLPERGGKIISLLDTASGREWLEAPSTELSGPVDANVEYDAGDMCGWDEMMPTLTACDYPGGPPGLPDHGELWTKVWEVTAREESSVTTTVSGEVLPYQLERTLRLGGRSLRVDYCLSTDADSERQLLWAAHPLFSVAAGTRLLLAPEEFDTPVNISLADEFAAGSSTKFFAELRAVTSTVKLVDASGTYLAMRWRRDDAPYVGVWLDNRQYSRHPVVGVEPTNSPFDSLTDAIRARKSWIVTSAQPRRWRLDIELGDATSAPPGSK